MKFLEDSLDTMLDKIIESLQRLQQERNSEKKPEYKLSFIFSEYDFTLEKLNGKYKNYKKTAKLIDIVTNTEVGTIIITPSVTNLESIIFVKYNIEIYITKSNGELLNIYTSITEQRLISELTNRVPYLQNGKTYVATFAKTNEECVSRCGKINFNIDKSTNKVTCDIFFVPI